MIGSWHPTAVKLLGSALCSVSRWRGRRSDGCAAQTARPTRTSARDASPPCTDCRGGEAGLPSSSNTIIMTPDGKTIVPRPVIREQADFRLNDALRNVPASTGDRRLSFA